jgi:hypothetical protein
MGGYLECAHEVCCIGGSVGHGAGIVVDLVCFVFGVRQKFFEFSDILPGFAEVEGAEIFIEAVIDEVLNGRMTTLSILK